MFPNLTSFARHVAGALLAGLFLTPATGAQAQNLFAPAITVNDEVITNYELEQRRALLVVLRAPGDPDELAREGMIRDKLRLQAAAKAEIEVTPEQLEAGIEEFASRTALTAEQLVPALRQEGIEPETLRDFVKVNIVWREYVRREFLPEARPSQHEIDRAMAREADGANVRVLLSEVIVPITPENQVEATALMEEISQIRSFDAFASAAQQYSAASTRNNGGRLEWLPLTQLPGNIRQAVLELEPGETTAPVALPNALAVFQLRALDAVDNGFPEYSEIDYAAYYIPGGRTPEALATAARLRDRVDTCNDLYGVAEGQPPSVLDREKVAPGQIPSDFAYELAKLDRNEVSTTVTRSNGQVLVFLMLCARKAAANSDVTRDAVANALVERRVTRLAETYLDKLEANAVIIDQ